MDVPYNALVTSDLINQSPMTAHWHAQFSAEY